MKEAYPSKMINGDLRKSSLDSHEHDSDNVSVRGSNEEICSPELNTSTRTISPVRAANSHAPNFIHKEERTDGRSNSEMGHPSNAGGSSEGHAMEEDVEKEDLEKICALENAPPPIKTQRGEARDASSQDLSPPPSPKRKKDLIEKEHILKRAFTPIFTEDPK